VPSFEVLLPFFVAIAIFAYIPGPAMIYATAQTIAWGNSAGLMAALGIHLGGYFHVFAAAAGLAILFQLVPALYTAFKFVGAAYLIWLGIKLFRSNSAVTTSVHDFEAISPRKAFWSSILVELLNPKTAIFFLTFLPQFADPGASWPVWAQLLILGTIVNLMFSSADLACVILSTRALRMLKKSELTTRLARRLGGSLLIGLGVHLAASRQ